MNCNGRIMEYTEPLVSVIVPIYNVEKYLDKCLQSIRSQDYSNLEVLMINDGSTDNSRAIAKKYEGVDKRFVLADKPNGGLSDARNFGLNMFKGKYVCFIDSDDFIGPSFVSNTVQVLENNSKADVVICGYALYNNIADKAYSPSANQDINEYCEEEKLRKVVLPLAFGKSGAHMSVWKNMYRSEVIINNNLRYISEREVYTEDKLFNLEFYILANMICEIPERNYYHLINYGSLSQSYRENYLDMLILCDKHVNRILSKYYGTQYVEENLCVKPSDLASTLITYGRAPFRLTLSNVKRLYLDERVNDLKNYDLNDLGSTYQKVIVSIYKIGNPVVTSVCMKAIVFMEPAFRKLRYQLAEKYEVNTGGIVGEAHSS